MLVLRGASLGAGTPARARLRRGDGSEGRGLRSGNAVVLRCPSGRPLRRSSGANDLGGGIIWHARVRNCCAVRFNRTDSRSCACSSVWCRIRRYRPRGTRCALGSSTWPRQRRSASFSARRRHFRLSRACRRRVAVVVRRSHARQTEDRVVGCDTGACQHRSRS